MDKSGHLTIRPARPEDSEAILRVHSASVRETCGPRYAPEVIESWCRVKSAEDYERDMTSPGQIVLIAEVDGEAIGFARLDIASVEIAALYVDPRGQGSGVGRALLERMEQTCIDRQLGSVNLNATLNAVGFYERMGFEVVRQDRFRLPDGVEIPCVKMKKELGRA